MSRIRSILGTAVIGVTLLNASPALAQGGVADLSASG